MNAAEQEVEELDWKNSHLLQDTRAETAKGSHMTQIIEEGLRPTSERMIDFENDDAVSGDIIANAQRTHNAPPAQPKAPRVRRKDAGVPRGPKPKAEAPGMLSEAQAQEFRALLNERDACAELVHRLLRESDKALDSAQKARYDADMRLNEYLVALTKGA